jgi:hypothetical protein
LFLEDSSTLDNFPTRQIPISDQSTSQQNDEFKRMRKVPFHHKDYCNEEAEEDEFGEDDEEIIFKEIKVEYMLTDGSKVLKIFII